MVQLLVALGSCSEALELAPLLQALARRGSPAAVAWLGEAAILADAKELGLPEPDHLRQPAPDVDAAMRFAEAAGFAAELLQREKPAAVLTLGHGSMALAMGLGAVRSGLPVLRLGAGQRSHAADCTVEAGRRLADHAATRWLAPTDLQQQELLREGLPPDRVTVAGSLLPAALAALPPAAREPFVWFALEHASLVQDREALQQLLETLAAAARQLRLPVRAAATVLGPALQRHGLPLPAGMALAAGLSARGQLDAARTAHAVVTDSAGYQELACVAGVPCVLLGSSTARPETLRLGACELVQPDAADLAPALARAFANARDWQSPYADALPAVLQAIAGLSAAAAARTAPAPAMRLPSDADHTGRTLGEQEIALVSAAIRSGTLNSTRGTFVHAFERRFASWLGRKHAIACASGSAAVHCAIAALGLQPGDEVVTTPITDMGALTPILYEGGVPVFADVDPRTLNVTARTIEAQLTARTRAIVVTHLFGMPCELDAILALARSRGLPVVEDTAQAFGATFRGTKLGAHGELAAFSLQQGKHITTGEGGIVACDDDALARRVFLFVNKAWGYGDAAPDHYFPALNYRLTELQGAVALAQLPKLDQVIAARREVAAALRTALADVPGLQLPRDPAHGTHSYWKFAFFVDPQVIAGGARALGGRMQGDGVACAPRYIQKPAFECALFRDWHASAVTWLPLQHNPRSKGPMPPFTRADYPGAVQALDEVVVLPINERYEPQHVAHVAAVIRTAARVLAHA